MYYSRSQKRQYQTGDERTNWYKIKRENNEIKKWLSYNNLFIPDPRINKI